VVNFAVSQVLRWRTSGLLHLADMWAAVESLLETDRRQRVQKRAPTLSALHRLIPPDWREAAEGQHVSESRTRSGVL
jgi:hypothetical protein